MEIFLSYDGCADLAQNIGRNGIAFRTTTRIPPRRNYFYLFTILFCTRENVQRPYLAVCAPVRGLHTCDSSFHNRLFHPHRVPDDAFDACLGQTIVAQFLARMMRPQVLFLKTIREKHSYQYSASTGKSNRAVKNPREHRCSRGFNLRLFRFPMHSLHDLFLHIFQFRIQPIGLDRSQVLLYLCGFIWRSAARICIISCVVLAR